MSILGAIVGGLIVGLLARFILPGRQNLSLPITAAIGIVAALIGWWVAGVLGVQSTSGIDWLRWIISRRRTSGWRTLRSASSATTR